MKENINPFEKFNSEWALVTAGTKDKFNSMTISWGSFGTLWFKKVITIYIRPDRYTFKFLEAGVEVDTEVSRNNFYNFEEIHKLFN